MPSLKLPTFTLPPDWRLRHGPGTFHVTGAAGNLLANGACPPCPSGPGIEALPGRGGCAIASPAPASAASERLLAAALALAMVALAGRRRSLRGCRLPR